MPQERVKCPACNLTVKSRATSDHSPAKARAVRIMLKPELLAQIEAAAAILRQGGVVAFPTETVYGLGADASNPDAVRRIFQIKGRPADHPLIVHLSDKSQLGHWAREVPEAARLLAEHFWPGPLTLILSRNKHVSDAVTGGQDTVGLRVPGHPVALALLRAMGPAAALAAPSANRYGRISPTTAAHVREELGDSVDMILDGGPCEVGLESTIVSFTGDTATVLRPGGIPLERTARAPACACRAANCHTMRRSRHWKFCLARNCGGAHARLRHRDCAWRHWSGRWLMPHLHRIKYTLNINASCVQRCRQIRQLMDRCCTQLYAGWTWLTSTACWPRQHPQALHGWRWQID
jgi:tRNA threonylcarbamoyl adenosine modification protein (Sua5/YciO/YrdC/YwlC family)